MSKGFVMVDECDDFASAKSQLLLAIELLDKMEMSAAAAYASTALNILESEYPKVFAEFKNP